MNLHVKLAINVLLVCVD